MYGFFHKYVRKFSNHTHTTNIFDELRNMICNFPGFDLKIFIILDD